MAVRAIAPKQLNDIKRSGQDAELIDVQSPVEFRDVHASFARNVPLDQLDAAKQAGERNGANHPLYLICRSSGRAQQACEKLIASGCTIVVNVEGGTQSLDQAELPVEQGVKAISLERQVRIAAGSLVLTGTLLRYFVDQYWIALPTFVGAGLLFAGLTDTCGIGIWLARMPWNQVFSPMTPIPEA